MLIITTARDLDFVIYGGGIVWENGGGESQLSSTAVKKIRKNKIIKEKGKQS